MRIGRVTRILARPAGLPSCHGRPSRGLDALLCGGCGAVMLPLVPGRLAQRESASFTPRRSLVRSQYRPRAGSAWSLIFDQLPRGPLYLPGGRAPRTPATGGYGLVVQLLLGAGSGLRNWWLRFGIQFSFGG